MPLKKRIKNKLKHIVSFLLHGEPDIVTAEIVTRAPSELLQGRWALVTGGTSGIGFAIAKAFLDAGAGVIITGRNAARLNSAAANLGHRDRVLSFVMDNTEVKTFEPTFSAMTKKVAERGGKHIDILVNNAGILGGAMPNATEAAYDAVMNTNLKGVFFLSQLVGRYMANAGIKGNILNIASSSGLRPANSAYILSKWGIRGLTLGLAKALAPHGITVNGIAPGPTATPMLIKSSNKNLANKTPLGRYVLPEEIAGMAVVLVSGMGKSIMGDIVCMTGGAAVLTFDDVGYHWDTTLR